MKLGARIILILVLKTSNKRASITTDICNRPVQYTKNIEKTEHLNKIYARTDTFEYTPLNIITGWNSLPSDILVKVETAKQPIFTSAKSITE